LTRGLARWQEEFQARGIAAFTLHDFRRTCRTGLSRLKIAPHIAERVLNHAIETYDVHDFMDEKREALDKWAAHLKGLTP
jgi:integrase